VEAAEVVGAEYSFTRAPAGETWPDKGQWQRVAMEDGSATARISCPKCGYIGLLDHEIADDGCVTPSIVCPNKDCDAHVGPAILMGWLA
jgi:hypothetical protein